MAAYDFILKFKLPSTNTDVDALTDRLVEAGCDDALIGVGMQGRIALDFTREARSASDAVYSAIRDVKRAIPGAELIEAGPDLVGLTEVSEIVEVSRQYMQKLVVSHLDFPSPVHAGNHVQLWHLEQVLDWLKARSSYAISETIIEIAHVARQCNAVRDSQTFESTGSTGRFRALLGA
jgi:hypothetical protein